MADHEVMRIRAAFDGVKTEMTELKASLHEINEALDGERFVSSDMIGALGEVVKRYREQASALESIGAELSIPIGEDITEIDNAIKLYEQKLSSQYIRSLVLDYFRLTAEAADVKMALEDSKRKLIEKCAVDETELPTAIEPYGTVVNHIRSGERRLPDDRYDLVEDQIGKSIARATERGDLTIDESYDISAYLDDSCPILAAEEKTDVEGAIPNSNIDSVDHDGENDEIVEDTELKSPVENDSGEDEADTEPVVSDMDNEPEETEQSALLPGYRGIAKGITVAIADNAPASSLKANEYKNLCKEKPEVPVAVFWLGHEKLRDESQRVDDSVNYYSPDPSIVNHLHSHGYMASLALESSLLTKRYLTLSEKGWACYTKQDVVKYLSSELFANKERARGLVVPTFLRSSVETWDEQTAISTAFIHEFFAKYHRNYQVFINNHSNLVCGDLITDKSVRVCSGIFAEGSGQRNLDALKEQLAELEGEDTLVLVVYTEEDRCVLADALDTSSPNVLFSVVKKDFMFMTAQGEERSADTVFGTAGNVNTGDTESEKTTDAAKHALFQDYQGYLHENATYTITADTPSSQLSSKAFDKHIGKTKGYIVPTTNVIANGKLCSDEDIDAPDQDYRSVPVDTIEYMTRQGYLRMITLVNGDYQKQFWTLSSKGWACFSKKEIADKLKQPDTLFTNAKKEAVNWNILILARYAMLYEYMVASHMIYSTFAYKDIVCGTPFENTTSQDMYIPAVFVRGAEDTDDLVTVLKANENFPQFIFIVKSMGDAVQLYSFLALVNRMCEEDHNDGIPIEKCQFVLIDQPETFITVDENMPEESEDGVLTENPTPSEEMDKAEASNSSADEAPQAARSGISTEVDQKEATTTTIPHSDETNAQPLKRTPEDIAKAKQYLDAAWLAQKAGRTDVAAVMLRSLVYRDPELKALADQFSYATGDPAIDGSPNSKALGIVFSLPAGNDAVVDTLAVAAYLRMYFSSAAGEQTYMSKDFSHQKDNLALENHPDLSEILYSLADWVRYQHRGLDAELIELLLRSQDTGTRQRALQQRAQDALNSHLTESSHSNKRIKRTREILFASGSDIWKTLTGIKDSNSDTRPLAESIVTKGVDKTIDDAWDEATRQLSFSRNEKCIGVERATLTRQLRNIMILIQEWLSVNITESRISNAQTRAAELLIQNLRPKMEVALKKLSSIDSSIPLDQQAAGTVLRDAVKQCLDRITGVSTQEDQTREYYINLLKEPLVALDDIDQPHIETPNEEIEPYDFCRRAMEYLDAPDHSWEYVLKRIFNETGSDHMGMDYGCAKVIQQYLTECGKEDIWKVEYNIDAAIADALDRTSVRRNSVALWEQDFTARLEMAEGDNWFEADQSLRNHIQKVIGRQKETYYYADNFGFYGRAMNRLFERLRNRAQGMRARYNDDFAKLTNGRSEEELSQPIFSQIKEMIGNDRFGAAASFMQQVRTGNLTIGNGELTSGTLQHFIDRVSDDLYRNARLETRKNLAMVFEAMHRKLTNATLKTGDILLKAWPEGNTLQGDKVRTFFTEMDLPVNNVTGQDTGFIVTFQDRGIVWDYPHPIADFGSRMDRNGIDVALITGNHDATGYHTEIDKLLRRIHGDRSLLLFINSAITVDDRRKLAKSVSRLTSSKPFILVDRCLALYLADTPKTDRWKTLLRCSLPFRVINPYYENSTLPIPPDMFIGRRKEIQDIIAPDGPNLLYGGRQLGKTAILRRVEFQRNRPAEGTWASYVDIRDMDHANAVSTIAKALVRNGFLPTNAKPGTWKELVDLIESQLMDNPASREHSLLLMLDEADTILTLFEDDNFQTLGDMKRLQQTTNGRFKFVLAGLHNVLRFSNKALAGNSVLPHLGGITIQPMKFSDGRELLEVPLSYLGFTIDQGQEDIIAQILYNTNYFPGLIHFYARKLVEHMKEIAPELTMPPYRLSRDILLRMIGDEKFREQRTEKLMMTLQVDEKDQDAYYYTLAYALAMSSYESEDVLLHGASAENIKATCVKEYPDCSIGKLANQQIEALLDELVVLNILRQEEQDGVRHYMFSRSSFLEMLGDENTVIERLLETLEKETYHHDAR